MSFLDTIKDPVKAATDGWHSFTHVVSNSADMAGDLMMKPVRAGRDLTAKLVSSVTNINEGDIKDSLNVLGTTLTNPMQTLTNAVGLTGEASTVVKNISSLAMLTNPVGLAALTLTKVSDGHWLSGDKTIAVQQVDSFKGNKSADAFDTAWAAYDKQNPGSKPAAERAGSKNETTPQSLDFSPEIYISNIKPAADRSADKGAETTTATSRDYTNANGEQVKVTANNGEIKYNATKDGKVVTEASQTADASTISHRGATATLDTKAGRLEFSNDQLKLLQQDGRAVIELGQRKIIKDASGAIKLFDSHGRLLQALSVGQLIIGADNDIHMFNAGTNLTDKARENKTAQVDGEAAADAKPPVNVFMTTAGDLLAELPDGSTMQRRKEDGNVMMRLASGQVVLVEAGSGHVQILRDGKFEPLTSGTDEADKAKEALIAGGIQVSGQTIAFQGGALDLKHQSIAWRGANNEHKHIDLSQTAPDAAGSQVTVKTETQTVVATGTNEVKTTDADGNKYDTDLTKGDVRTPEVYVAPQEIRAKQNDGQEVIISKENEVAFDGGKGPRLHRNGSQDLDEQTSTDSTGHVRSGSWSGSFAGAAMAQRAQLETAATNTSMNARNNANCVYGKAAGGMVTFSDISALNSELGDVSAMINQLAAAGATDLIGELQNSCAALIETINFATPKAAACQIAMERGITSPSMIKQIEDGTYGRSPEQAVNVVMAA
jgi:hypothetical protein